MGELRVIRIDVQADSAEEYVDAAAKRFSQEFFVPTDEVVGGRVRVEAPFLGGSVGIRGEATATAATRDGRKGYVLRMVELDRDSVHVQIPVPLEEESAPLPTPAAPIAPIAAAAAPTPAPTPVARSVAKPSATKPAEAAVSTATKPDAPNEATPTTTKTALVAVAAASEITDALTPATATAQDFRPVDSRRRIGAVVGACIAMVGVTVLLVTRRTQHSAKPSAVAATAQTASEIPDAVAGATPAPSPAPVPTPVEQAPPAPVDRPVAIAADRPTSGKPARTLRADGGVVDRQRADGGVQRDNVEARTDVGSGAASAPVRPPIAARPPIRPAAPQSVSPRDDARITCKSFGTEIELVWAAVPGATGYVVEVARDGSFGSIVATIEVEAVTVGIFRPMAPGAFVWRVTTRDAHDVRSEPGTVRRFTCLSAS